MATTTLTERFDTLRGPRNFYGMNMTAHRREGEAVAELTTHGRTNAAQRQEVADGLATITETATVERIDRNNFVVRFRLTHRIVPIDQPEKEVVN